MSQLITKLPGYIEIADDDVQCCVLYTNGENITIVIPKSMFCFDIYRGKEIWIEYKDGDVVFTERITTSNDDSIIKEMQQLIDSI